MSGRRKNGLSGTGTAMRGALTAEATGESRVEGDDDSSEHRRQFAACLEGKVDRRTIDAGILADGENAKHPPRGCGDAAWQGGETT